MIRGFPSGGIPLLSTIGRHENREVIGVHNHLLDFFHPSSQNAAKLQREELSWVSNLYLKRLTELEQQTKNYEQWLQSRNEHT